MPAPKKVTDEQVREAIQRIDRDGSTITAEAEQLDISSQGLGKRIRKLRKETMKVSKVPMPVELSPPIVSTPEVIDDGPGFVASATPDTMEQISDMKPNTALEFVELVKAFMRANPNDNLVKKALRHLPANPEWKGKMPTKGPRRGGGWSGPWKDFAALIEKALRRKP